MSVESGLAPRCSQTRCSSKTRARWFGAIVKPGESIEPRATELIDVVEQSLTQMLRPGAEMERRWAPHPRPRRRARPGIRRVSGRAVRLNRTGTGGLEEVHSCSAIATSGCRRPDVARRRSAIFADDNRTALSLFPEDKNERAEIPEPGRSGMLKDFRARDPTEPGAVRIRPPNIDDRHQAIHCRTS